MKRLLHISSAFTLIVTLLLGYTGIPVYRMVCEAEGKTVVSITDLRGSCGHDEQKKHRSCCEPVSKAPEKKGHCCDYSISFHKLNEVVPVQEGLHEAGCILTAVACIFPEPVQPLLNQGSAHSCGTLPPLWRLKPKQSIQSITQSFLI